ncbi:MAG: protein-L-isoaspartate O-methyltransferase [Pseudomonadota bacterium]
MNQTAESLPNDMQSARKAMIDSQLRTSGVNEEYVLKRMMAVPREDFVPTEAHAVAYMDRALPIGNGHYLAAPVVHGKMLIEASPAKEDRVLIVENGSSYLTELIRPLVGEIDTMDAETAASKASGKRKTYTLIVVDGAIEHLPDSLGKRLAEGGRLVTGVVERGITRLAFGRKVSGAVSLQTVADIGMPVLHAFDQTKGWSFS